MSSNADGDEEEIKTILVGMSGTGKTNIINALTNQKFDSKSMSTMTSTFVDRYFNRNGKKYRLEIWDTAGQEKFRSLTKIFIKDSKIVIFVYDITTKKSFEEIDFWVQTVKDILGDTPIFGLAGNKKDLYDQEQVTIEEGEAKAKDIGAIFKQTSAKCEVPAINKFAEELLDAYIVKNGGKIDNQADDKIDINKPKNNEGGSGKKKFFKC